MSKELAMKKIEQKLKQAMQRIADLSSEKEQLEHIVIRLQDETDTVGEYITIYQYQRAQQKAQLHEKEQQLHSVAQDREELKQKLAQLQGLLTRYLGKANVEEPQENSTSDAEPCEVAEEAAESPTEVTEVKQTAKHEGDAGKILSLLSEIGSSEMLTCEASALEQRFQPWFWGPNQGKLMTV